MSADTIFGIVGTFVGLVGIVISIYAIADSRRQRTGREKAVIAARATIERAYGLLIGIKPGVEPTLPSIAKAIDNGLSAIDQEREELAAL